MPITRPLRRHMRAKLALLGAILLGILATKTAYADETRLTSPESSLYKCGGEVEGKVWLAWDRYVRKYVSQNLLEKRLFRDGDVYALYDFQIISHNVVAMAARCGRNERMREFADLIHIAYKGLTPGTSLSPGRRWVCRGGIVCNASNRLLNTEVLLNSAQFLGLAASVANAMVRTEKKLDFIEKQFVSETVEVIIEHLARWGTGRELYNLNRLARAKSQDVRGGSSELFFTDKHLWLITIYAELSTVMSAADRHLLQLPMHRLVRLEPHLHALLKLFQSRISFRTVKNRNGKSVQVADVDREFWRLYRDNNFAGYEGEEKPVTCIKNGAARSDRKPVYRIYPDAKYQRHDTGWDFSHARRLVQGMDALLRNRETMQSIFALPGKILPTEKLAMALANNLVEVIWNGNFEQPLFSNYWSGANGWFRVAYDNGTGNCREGYPPFGLSDSFLDGGYISWARYRPEIGVLGQRMYTMLNEQEAYRPFLEKYYSSFINNDNPTLLSTYWLAFLPTLVGTGIE